MDPIITVASGTEASVLAYAGQLFTDLTSLIVLAIGLPVGFYVLNRVISMVRGRAKS